MTKFAFLFAVAALVGSSSADAQINPSRPVTVVVGTGRCRERRRRPHDCRAHEDIARAAGRI